MTTTTTSARTGTARRLLTAAGIGTAVAIAAALLVYALARLTGADLVVAPPGQPPGVVNAGSIIVITLVSGVGALLLALLLARVLPRRARLIFLVLALAVLVLSFFGPIGAARETSTAVWLNLMHVVVAVPIIGLILRALPGSGARQAARR